MMKNAIDKTVGLKAELHRLSNEDRFDGPSVFEETTRAV